jgi:hypothetical protein
MFYMSSRPIWRADLASCVMGNVTLSPVVKGQEREAKYSLPSSAEVKKIGSISPLLLKSSGNYAELTQHRQRDTFLYNWNTSMITLIRRAAVQILTPTFTFLCGPLDLL